MSTITASTTLSSTHLLNYLKNQYLKVKNLTKMIIT